MIQGSTKKKTHCFSSDSGSKDPPQKRHPALILGTDFENQRSQGSILKGQSEVQAQLCEFNDVRIQGSRDPDKKDTQLFLTEGSRMQGSGQKTHCAFSDSGSEDPAKEDTVNFLTRDPRI